MATREPIIFRDGVIFVRPEQPNLAEFLDAHPATRPTEAPCSSLSDKEKKAKVDVDTEFLDR